MATTVAHLNERLNGVVERLDEIAPADDQTAEDFRQQVKNLHRRIVIVGPLAERTQLEVYLDAIELLELAIESYREQMVFQGELIANTFDRIDNVNGRVDDIIAPDRTRIIASGEASPGFDLGIWVLAAIAGIVVAVVYWLIASSAISASSDWRNFRSGIAALIVGVAVGLFVASFERLQVAVRAHLQFGVRPALPPMELNVNIPPEAAATEQQAAQPAADPEAPEPQDPATEQQPAQPAAEGVNA